MLLQDKKITLSKNGARARSLSFCAMLLGVALLLSYLEHLLPPFFLPLPGVRLGWAQGAITVAYFFLGRREAALISAVRVVLMGLLFGTAMSFCFSACGALLSFLGLLAGECLLSRRCSYLGLGVLCAVLHNVGQALAAAVFFGVSAAWAYLPVLVLGGILTGAIGGVILNGIVPRLVPIFRVSKGGVSI